MSDIFLVSFIRYLLPKGKRYLLPKKVKDIWYLLPFGKGKRYLIKDVKDVKDIW